ncbi:MAG: zinc ribbon domain-containing protein, partial [SAR202 cluster bacterium]|nr:zinc ribbon domain-containing protein [SAR202 cluster bacterium]
MKCPSCGRENLEDAKFCSGCGIKFEELLKCAGCGAELALDDRFCSACGKPVEDSPEPIEPPTESLPEESKQHNENFHKKDKEMSAL